MVELLFNLFFSKTNKTQTATIIKDREISSNFRQISQKKKQVENTTTCLSEYFKDRHGLNTKERLSYSLLREISYNA